MSVVNTRESASSARKSGAPQKGPRPRPVLITGGAGFIGSNLAHRLLCSGQRVVLFDSLSRTGAQRNWEWLHDEHASQIELVVSDVRDLNALKKAVAKASAVFHLAAQVAVTRSLANPLEDFEVNARGTLNLLEALRARSTPPPLICASTSKIYGDMADIRICTGERRCEPVEPLFRLNGFGELTPQHSRTPYGCSKGAACQYVLDYSRTFKIPGVVFCMSSVYGPHQLGTEDQGWVAHFLSRALRGGSITVYGDGKQVRDLLFVDDLVDALLLAQEHISQLSGQVYNIGGGPENALSLTELLDLIAKLRNVRPKISFEPGRLADQRYFVSDIRKFCRATGWMPSVGVREGVERLCRWMESEEMDMLSDLGNKADGNGAKSPETSSSQATEETLRKDVPQEGAA